MLLTHEVTRGVEVLSVLGPVAGSDAAELQSAVRRAVDVGPRGVVIDLSDAGPLAPAAVDVLNWATSTASGWPRPSLAVCCADDELAELLHPDVQQHPCRDDAIAHVDDRTEEHVCARATLSDGPEAPGEARRLARSCAEQAGMDGDDLAVVVSELVTNAVRHGAPPIRIEIATCEHCVTVVVADGGLDRPAARVARTVDEGGRGLLLVDLLAAGSGVRAEPPGKAVWAELPRR